MTDFAKMNEQLENESMRQSIGPNEYHLNTIQKEGSPVYPWAPTARLQKIGGSLLGDKNLTDVDSELMNLTRKLSNNPKEQYQPGQGFKPSQSLKDGYFHQDSSRLTNGRIRDNQN